MEVKHMSDRRILFHWRCSVATHRGAFFLAASSVSQELLKGEQCKKSGGVFLEETSVQNTEACLWFSHFAQSVLLCQKLTGRRQSVAPSCTSSCLLHPVIPFFSVTGMWMIRWEKQLSGEISALRSDPLAIVCTWRGFFVFLSSVNPPSLLPSSLTPAPSW